MRQPDYSQAVAPPDRGSTGTGSMAAMTNVFSGMAAQQFGDLSFALDNSIAKGNQLMADTIQKQTDDNLALVNTIWSGDADKPYKGGIGGMLNTKLK
jgi:hypothetical protein